MAAPSVALPVYQQNAQAAKTTPVVTNRLRTIKTSFMIRLRREAKFKPTRPYLPATTRGYDAPVSLPPYRDLLSPHCNSGFRFCSINGHVIKSSDRSADCRARRTRMTIGPRENSVLTGEAERIKLADSGPTSARQGAP
jgi:hypothetical protein